MPEVLGENVLSEFLDVFDDEPLAVLGPADHAAVALVLI